MDAGCAVGAEAVAQRDTTQLEMFLEVGPLVGGDIAVFGGIAQGTAAGDELLVP